MISRWLMLKPSWTTLTISVRMRASGLTIGKQQDSCARLLLWYSSKSGERIGPWPDMPEIGADGDWMVHECTAAVPSGADRLMIACQLYLATGTVDFADVSVVAH